MLYAPIKLDIDTETKHAEVLHLPFPISLVGQTFTLGDKSYVVSDRLAIVPAEGNTTSVYSLIGVSDKKAFLKQVLGYKLTAWNDKDDTTLSVSYSKKFNSDGKWESSDMAGLMLVISAIFEKFADKLIGDGKADMEAAKASAKRIADIEATRARTVTALTPEAIASMYTSLAEQEAAKAKAEAEAATDGIVIDAGSTQINIKVAQKDGTQSAS